MKSELAPAFLSLPDPDVRATFPDFLSRSPDIHTRAPSPYFFSCSLSTPIAGWVKLEGITVGHLLQQGFVLEPVVQDFVQIVLDRVQ